jgi:hypothetical protein
MKNLLGLIGILCFTFMATAQKEVAFNDCNNDIVVAKFDQPSGRIYLAVKPAEQDMMGITMSSFKEFKLVWFYHPKDTPVNGVLYGVHRNHFNENSAGSAFANWFGGINTQTAGEAGITISPSQIKSAVQKGKIIFYIKLDKQQLRHLNSSHVFESASSLLDEPKIWLN